MSYAFCAWKACLVNLELPKEMFICSDFIGDFRLSRKFKGAFLHHPKVLAAVMALDEGSRT